MLRQSTTRARSTAIVIELLPLPATLMYFGLAGKHTPGWSAFVIAPIFFAMILATGVGWATLGRWDVGCAAALIRIVGTIAAIWLFLVVVRPCIIECSRSHPKSDPALSLIFGTLIGIAYFVPTLGSPLWLIWALRRESRVQKDLP